MNINVNEHKFNNFFLFSLSNKSDEKMMTRVYVKIANKVKLIKL